LFKPLKPLTPLYSTGLLYSCYKYGKIVPLSVDTVL